VLQYLANKFRRSAKRFVCITAKREEAAQEQLPLPYINDLNTTPRDEGAHFMDAAVDQKLRVRILRSSDEIICAHTPYGAGRLRTIEVENLVLTLAGEPIPQKTGECLDARCVFRPLIRDLARGVAVVEIGNHQQSDRFFCGAGLNRLRGK
ncbi:MAG: hypothetical protein WCD26_24260, partial [Pseudolabrys sp.]